MANVPMHSNMRPILDALEIVLNTWCVAVAPPIVNRVFYGYTAMPYQIPSEDFPYLCIDAANEIATDEAPEHMEKKAYNVRFELGVFGEEIETSERNSLRDLLDRWDDIIRAIWPYRKLHDPSGNLLCDTIRPLTVNYDIMTDKEDNPQFRVAIAIVEFRTWQEADRRMNA